MNCVEINFDGLVGPTHNYSGLSYGNLAAMRNQSQVSSPKKAALEGLAKMKFLMDLGLRQAVFPPHERPHLPTLRKLGFTGTDADILEKAHQHDPTLLASVCSASSMWAANAATVSPSADTQDHRVHFTPANLIGNLHRSIEPPTTTRVLRAIFSEDSHFIVHDPLPATLQLGDEGAANHTRLCADLSKSGIEVFTYGRAALNPSSPTPKRFPARQTLEASQAIARRHLLNPASVIFIQQNPDAIDAGAFHNDVVAVGHQSVMLFHENAYLQPEAISKIAIHDLYYLASIKVPASLVSLEEAVSTYLFNSQLVTLPNGTISLIAPMECRENPKTFRFLEKLSGMNTPIKSVHFVDVRQSMSNGGGPACLRLRVTLSDQEMQAVKGRVFLNDSLHDELKAWIEKHYRDELRPDDLRDPNLLNESRAALDQLTQILRLGSVFEFQQA